MSDDRNPASAGVEDFIRAGGYLMLGTRLKRLGDRLQADVQHLCRSDGIDVPAGLMPVLAVLHDRGTLAVSDIARAIGIAQPGATRAIGRLEEAGLVRSASHDRDQRVRLVALTPAGDAVIARLRSDAWPRIERAVATLCGELDGPLLEQLAAIEDALDSEGLDRRAERAVTA